MDFLSSVQRKSLNSIVPCVIVFKRFELNISKGISDMKVFFTILQVLAGLAVTVIVLLQSGKSSGLGAVSGAAETFSAKEMPKPGMRSLPRLPSGLRLHLFSSLSFLTLSSDGQILLQIEPLKHGVFRAFFLF